MIIDYSNTAVTSPVRSSSSSSDVDIPVVLAPLPSSRIYIEELSVDGSDIALGVGVTEAGEHFHLAQTTGDSRQDSSTEGQEEPILDFSNWMAELQSFSPPTLMTEETLGLSDDGNGSVKSSR